MITLRVAAAIPLTLLFLAACGSDVDRAQTCVDACPHRGATLETERNEHFRSWRPPDGYDDEDIRSLLRRTECVVSCGARLPVPQGAPCSSELAQLDSATRGFETFAQVVSGEPRPTALPSVQDRALVVEAARQLRDHFQALSSACQGAAKGDE